MQRWWWRWPALSLAAWIGLSGCDDCDDKIRKAVSNRERERRGDAREDPDGQPVSSEPREAEPNDGRAQATPVALGAELRAVLAEISTGSDRDWYELRADEDLQLELEVDPRDEALDLVVVLDADQTELRYDLAGPGEPEVIPVLGLGPAHPRAVRVQAKQGAGAYALRFRRRLAGGAIEAEPNDVRAVAQPLQVPGQIQGFYDRPGDRDVLVLELPEAAAQGASVWSLEVDGVDGLSQQLALYDAVDAEAPALSMSAGPGQSLRLPNLGVRGASKRLWLALSASGGYDRQKAYRVSLSSPPPLGPDQAFEIEPNDHAESAAALALAPGAGELTVRGWLHRAGDQDHLVLRLGPQGPEEEGQAVESGSETPPDEPSSEQLGAAEGDPGGIDVGSLGAAPDPTAEVFPRKDPPAHLLEMIARPQDASMQLGVDWRPGTAHARRLQAPAKGEPVSLCHVPLEHGVYPFVVRAQLRPEGLEDDGYVIEVRDHARGARAEGLEIEPNDARDRADPIPKAGKIEGFIASSQDRDVFGFVVPEEVGAQGVGGGASPFQAGRADAAGAPAGSGAAGRRRRGRPARGRPARGRRCRMRSWRCRCRRGSTSCRCARRAARGASPTRSRSSLSSEGALPAPARSRMMARGRPPGRSASDLTLNSWRQERDATHPRRNRRRIGLGQDDRGPPDHLGLRGPTRHLYGHGLVLPRPEPSDDARAAPVNFDHPNAFDVRAVRTPPLRAPGDWRAIQKPVYDFSRSTRAERVVPIEPAPIIIVEGILVLAIAEVRELLHARIFVSTDGDIRFIRRLQRDVTERGRSLESVISQYTGTVRPMHHAFVEPSKRHADVVIRAGAKTRWPSGWSSPICARASGPCDGAWWTSSRSAMSPRTD